MVERGRKGSRADLTHKDLAKALKQKQQCKMCDKVENRLLVEEKLISKLTRKVGSKHAVPVLVVVLSSSVEVVGWQKQVK